MKESTIGVILVLFTTLLEGLGQVSLKKSVRPVGRGWVWLGLGVVVLALEAVLYTKALVLLNVGVAYAVSCLSLVSIALLSRWLLGERLSGQRWAGVGFILLGVVLVTVRV